MLARLARQRDSDIGSHIGILDVRIRAVGPGAPRADAWAEGDGSGPGEDAPLGIDTGYGPAALRTLAVQTSPRFEGARAGHGSLVSHANVIRKCVRTLAYSTPLRQLAHSPVSAIARLSRS